MRAWDDVCFHATEWAGFISLIWLFVSVLVVVIIRQWALLHCLDSCRERGHHVILTYHPPADLPTTHPTNHTVNVTLIQVMRVVKTAQQQLDRSGVSVRSVPSLRQDSMDNRMRK